MKSLMIASLGLLMGANSMADSAPRFDKQTTLLGKKFGVGFNLAANSSQTGIMQDLNAVVLGKQKSLLKMALQAGSDLATGELQVYVNGRQISGVKGSLLDGHWERELKIPPVNVKGTVVSIPIGPLNIGVDGGFTLDGGLKAALAVETGEGELPLPEMIRANVDADVQSAGFVQGTASVLFIRGGVKGQVNLADGELKTAAGLSLGSFEPTYSAKGDLSLFAGKVSALAEYRGLFSGWNRLFSATLFHWDGVCFHVDNGIQVSGKCVKQ